MDDDEVVAVFPNGFRILVVDNDLSFLETAKVMLSSCHYKVTTCNNPITALSILQEREGEFDALLSDIHMTLMSGFDLLKIVEGEMGIPVIFVSVNTKKDIMIKGILEGACYFLKKPLNINDIANLWRVVAWRKFSTENIGKEQIRDDGKGKALATESSPTTVNDQGGSNDFSKDNINKGKNIDNIDRNSKGNKKNKSKKHGDGSSSETRKRMIWTPDLEEKFENAVNQLGIETQSKLADEALPELVIQLLPYKYRIRVTREQRERMNIYMNPHNYPINHAFPIAQLPNQLITFPNPSPNPPMLSPQVAPQYVLSPYNYPMPNIIDGQPISSNINPNQFLENQLNIPNTSWNGMVPATNNLLPTRDQMNYYNFDAFPTTSVGETNTSNYNNQFEVANTATNNDDNFYYSNTMQYTEKENSMLASEFTAPMYSEPHPSLDISMTNYMIDDASTFEFLMGLNQSENTANPVQQQSGFGEVGSSSNIKGDELDKFLDDVLIRDDNDYIW
ncbi:two-component response regulator ORR21-like [Ananas comosus]|uniref:Two-component response regulator ORR21-like n=1 Tax=Ananas comosus TaxID=4615 RepID=A0A6P5GZY7_ANACO|nr:two-component response regulator ORR21-like [Ananas comosus]